MSVVLVGPGLIPAIIAVSFLGRRHPAEKTKSRSPKHLVPQPRIVPCVSFHAAHHHHEPKNNCGSGGNRTPVQHDSMCIARSYHALSSGSQHAPEARLFRKPGADRKSHPPPPAMSSLGHGWATTIFCLCLGRKADGRGRTLCAPRGHVDDTTSFVAVASY